MVEELSIFAIDGASSWEIAKCIGVDDMGLSRWVGRVLYDAETTNPYIYFVERLDDKHGLSESLVEVLIRVAVTLTKSSVSMTNLPWNRRRLRSSLAIRGAGIRYCPRPSYACGLRVAKPQHRVASRLASYVLDLYSVSIFPKLISLIGWNLMAQIGINSQQALQSPNVCLYARR